MLLRMLLSKCEYCEIGIVKATVFLDALMKLHSSIFLQRKTIGNSESKERLGEICELCHVINHFLSCTIPCKFLNAAGMLRQEKSSDFYCPSVWYKSCCITCYIKWHVRRQFACDLISTTEPVIDFKGIRYTNYLYKSSKIVEFC